MSHEESLPSLAELFPDGRIIYYEGDEPFDEVLKRIEQDLGFKPHVSITIDCPAEHMDAIYGSTKYGVWGS